MANQATPDRFLSVSSRNETPESLVNYFLEETERIPNGVKHPEGPFAGLWMQEPNPLHAGDFGTAWLQKEAGGQRLRVVKQIKKAIPNMHEGYWIQEVLLMARLSKNPKIFPELYCWFQDDDHVYIAIEYFGFGALEQHIHCPLDDLQSSVISAQIAGALRFMHARRIVHHDLKPASIHIRSRHPSWRVVVADFSVSEHAHYSGRVTDESLDFRAPEILRCMHNHKKGANAKAADLWSLSCIAYWLMTMKTPVARQDMERFCGHSSADLLEVIRSRSLTELAANFILANLKPLPEDRLTAAETRALEWVANISTCSEYQDNLRQPGIITRQSGYAFTTLERYPLSLASNRSEQNYGNSKVTGGYAIYGNVFGNISITHCCLHRDPVSSDTDNDGPGRGSTDQLLPSVSKNTDVHPESEPCSETHGERTDPIMPPQYGGTSPKAEVPLMGEHQNVFAGEGTPHASPTAAPESSVQSKRSDSEAGTLDSSKQPVSIVEAVSCDPQHCEQNSSTDRKIADEHHTDLSQKLTSHDLKAGDSGQDGLLVYAHTQQEGSLKRVSTLQDASRNHQYNTGLRWFSGDIKADLDAQLLQIKSVKSKNEPRCEPFRQMSYPPQIVQTRNTSSSKTNSEQDKELECSVSYHDMCSGWHQCHRVRVDDRQEEHSTGEQSPSSKGALDRGEENVPQVDVKVSRRTYDAAGASSEPQRRRKDHSSTFIPYAPNGLKSEIDWYAEMKTNSLSNSRSVSPIRGHGLRDSDNRKKSRGKHHRAARSAPGIPNILLQEFYQLTQSLDQFGFIGTIGRFSRTPSDFYLQASKSHSSFEKQGNRSKSSIFEARSTRMMQQGYNSTNFFPVKSPLRRSIV